jgi:hypothetical protein
VTLNPLSFRKYIYNGVYDTLPYIAAEGDVVTVRFGNNRAKSLFVLNGMWTEVTNTKSVSQPAPLFNLYDINETYLGDYNESNFAGSEIFSYVLDFTGNISVDQILNLPIVYKNLGQGSDILFENDLITNRYTFLVDGQATEITGYYFYRILDQSQNVFENSWHLSETPVAQNIQQEFIYTDSNKFKISVIPEAIDPVSGLVINDSDLFVTVNGVKKSFVTFIENGNLYFSVNGLIKNDFVVIEYYSREALTEDMDGFYKIPISLESNVKNGEVATNTLNELTTHFLSIISNQEGANSFEIGQSTNFRDTNKDLSKGTVIVQTLGNLSKVMICSNNDLDLVKSIDYSKKEYSKFKTKLLNIAKKKENNQLPVSNVGVIDKLLSDIFAEINQSRQTDSEFSNSKMLALGDVFSSEIIEALPAINISTILLNDLEINQHFYIFSNKTNSKSLVLDEIFNYTNDEEMFLLVEGIDYTINDNEILFSTDYIGSRIEFRLYSNYVSYVPHTPASLGMTKLYSPMLYLDYSYSDLTWVILGHDGSKTVSFGDYDLAGNIVNPDIRDVVLLDFESRVYNSSPAKFKAEGYEPLLSIKEVVPKFNNTTKFKNSEIEEILYPSFSLWTTKNSVNYRINEFYDSNNWKTYNYNNSTLEVSGSWRAIYSYYIGSDDFNMFPWKLLGFSNKPDWWDTEYGVSTSGLYTSLYTSMWSDIGNGIIKSGARAGTYSNLSNTLIIDQIPVDSSGNIIPVLNYFSADFNTFQSNWEFGNISPVEYAWRCSSEHQYELVKLLLLTKPAKFSEIFWNTLDRETYIFNKEDYYTGKNIQYLNNNGFRVGSAVDLVHSEENSIKLGYQTWVSDYLRKYNKDVKTSFGDLVRNISVNLAHRLGGYTNNKSLRVFLQGSTVVGSNTLRIPDNNLQVLLRTGYTTEQKTYSGVIVQLVAGNKFKVFGYDNLSSAFKYFDIDRTKSTTKVTQGGTPASFTNFQTNKFYTQGDIIRYNTVFYRAKESHNATFFDEGKWAQLNSLPVIGGVTVELYQYTENLKAIEYGYEFDSVQDVFSFLIGYGYYLESEGWNLFKIDSVSGEIKNWNQAANEFLFWTVGENPINSVVFLNPIADEIEITVSKGYPQNIEQVVNDVYSILDKTGRAIEPNNSLVKRSDQTISVSSLNAEGIFLLRVRSNESEHAVIFDNITTFGDVIYDPLLGIRQERLRITCILTQDWYGRISAPGYLVTGNTIAENYDNLLSTNKNYYNTESVIDNEEIEFAARSITGYTDRDYFSDAGITNEVQFNFYQGFIKEKGTTRSIRKALRSDAFKVTSQTEIFEEWAFKRADFGSTSLSSIDVRLDPNYMKSKNQIVSLNYNGNAKGEIKSISLIQANQIYNEIPAISISRKPADIGNLNIVDAQAVAVLGTDRKIKEIIVTNPGSNYTLVPDVSIVNSTDVAFAELTYYYNVDSDFDNIYNIDVNDTLNVLSLKPYTSFNPASAASRNFKMPVAGYVNFNDVDHSVYNTVDIFGLYQSTSLREGDTVYVGNSANGSWNVYKLVSAGFNLVENNRFCTLQSIFGSNDPAKTTSLSNEIGIVFVGADLKPFEYRWDNNINSYILYNSAGVPEFFDQLQSSGTSVYFGQTVRTDTIMPLSYSEDYWVDDANRAYGTVSSVDSQGRITGVNLLSVGKYTNSPSVIVNSDTGSGTELSSTLNSNGEVSVVIFSAGTGYVVNDIVKFSRPETARWQVYKNNTLYREEEKLFDNNSLNEAYIYDLQNSSTLARLPVFDPVKGLLNGLVEQNVDYKSYSDPASYTNYNFGKSEIGKVWLDLSSFKYVYYEQPKSVTETTDENLEYCRNMWGNIFPGSKPKVYEWISSTIHPAEYQGPGLVKNVNEFVQLKEYSTSELDYITVYYFWVSDLITKPNLANRTLAIKEIANVISLGKNSGYQSYAGIKNIQGKNSYALFSVDYIIANNNTALNISYGSEESKHTEWTIVSENSDVTELPKFIWNKFVDSLCGYTSPLSEMISGDAIAINGEYILPVPNKRLLANDISGLNSRPRQTMFLDLKSARREFTYILNSILKEAPFNTIYEEFNTYNSYLLDNVDWVRQDYEGKLITPVVQSNFLSEIDMTTLKNKDIVKVNSIFVNFYVYENDSFELIKVERGTKKLNSVLENSSVSLYIEDFRPLLGLLDEVVLTGQYKQKLRDLFFKMVQYSFSEQPVINWAFKTSYISVKQQGVQLEQTPYFSSSITGSLLDFVQEAKPYHTKVRSFTFSLDAGIEDLIYAAEENYNFKVSIKYDRLCQSRGWDKEGWDTNVYDPVEVECKNQLILESSLFTNGWDVANWDILNWDNEYFSNGFTNFETGLFTDDDSLYEIYDDGLFNSPYANGEAEELYINGTTESAIIIASVLNIPEDIDVSVYPINSSLAGQTVSTNSGNYYITEVKNMYVLSSY